MIPPPKCARTLNVKGIGKCPDDVFRFRTTCLSCRIRRAFIGKFSLPKFYIEYTYKSFYYIVPFGRTPTGELLVDYMFPHVNIDPRGHFLAVRLATIRVLDSLIGLSRKINKSRLHQCRPWVEFAEFLANYPVW